MSVVRARLSQMQGVKDFYASCGGVFLCECHEEDG